MKDKHFVKWHKIKTVKGDMNSYERWNETTAINKQSGELANRFDFVTEDVRANPDSFKEDESLYIDVQLTSPQELMGEAIEHLQGRQKEVYLLTMREDKSIAEAAIILGISKSTAQSYRDRAIKFIKQYCKKVMNNVK